MFLKSPKDINPDFFRKFQVDKANKSYEFWKRETP